MSIFKAFQKDRKIGTTPFSLNFQNILTANFGGLTPIGHFPVLPKDKFKMGTNILTKVEPMPAPAFTRIKQNQYAFFVPNAQTWKHWNDYVSNGTAYADTYGNNSNNQQTDNLWRPPQISVNQLQLISKVANGYSIPIFKEWLGSAIGAVLLNKLTESEIKFLINNIHLGGSDSNTSGNVTQFFMVVLKKASQLNLIPEFITTDIPYINAVFRGDITSEAFLALTPLKKLEYIFEQIFCEVGCDMVTAFRLWSWFTTVTSNDSTPETVKMTGYVEDMEKETYLSSEFFKVVSIRSFCDNVSNDVSLKHSPFILEKRSYVSPATYNRPITYYVYVKNKYQDSLVNATVGNKLRTGGVHDQGYYNRRVRNCGYFWSIDCSQISTSADNAQTTYYPWYLNNYTFNPMPTNPDMDLAAFLGFDSPELFAADDLFLTMFNFKNTPNELLYDTLRDLSAEPLPQFTSLSAVCDTDAANLAHQVTPFTLYQGETVSNNMLGLENQSVVNNFRRYTNLFDTELPLLFEPSVNATGNPYGLETTDLPQHIFFTYEAYNLGYDCWSLFVYLCKNSCKLLDYFNIPLEGFTARSFDLYVGEFVKALPFMAYSKIWNDYFRNKVTSSAELDYREVNSVGCIDFAAYVFMRDCYTSGVSSDNFPKWLGDKIVNEDNPQNGWCLPFSCAPKNALENGTLKINDDVTINISDVNHFHDLRCMSWWSLISVLTGWQLQDLCIRQISEFFAVKSKKLYGILAEKLYLPSYYNGLLHYKYQNFNKDYFSSALLDPMSGANQENIGDTVNSLINAEAKQGFWNRLAQNRSVTQFWQSVFGVTPSHNDYDKPLMLGSAHTDVNVGEVVQLSQTDSTPQGQRSGLGSAHDSSGLFKHTFNEHGYIIILLSHTLELQYMQGLEKDWTPEESFLDLPFIDFVGLGNQSINQKELNFTTKPKLYPASTSNSFSDDVRFYWNQSTSYDLTNKINNVYPSTPRMMYNHRYPLNNNQLVHANLANGSGQNLNDIFGYIPRYSTWKFKFDQCHGEFRNDLMFWHSFRKFFTQPILCHEFVNWEFMSENDELMRMFFVMDESTDKFKIDAFINATGVRPLPYVCTPKTSI